MQAPLHVENPLQNIVFKSITLKTVHGRKIFHSWEESEKLIQEKKYNDFFIKLIAFIVMLCL